MQLQRVSCLAKLGSAPTYLPAKCFHRQITSLQLYYYKVKVKKQHSCMKILSRDYHSIGWRFGALVGDLWSKGIWIPSFNFLAGILNPRHVITRVSTVLACARIQAQSFRGKASTMIAKEEERGLKTMKILNKLTLFSWEHLLFCFSLFCATYLNLFGLRN